MKCNDDIALLSEQAKRRIRVIPLHEFVSIPITERPLLVDVREKREWEEGHAEGAVHLDPRSIEHGIGEIAPDLSTPIVCYSEGGHRSSLVVEDLQKLGYTHLACLADGFEGWVTAGEPIVHPVFR